MGRIGDAFDSARNEGRAALVIYVCGGDPDLETTQRLVLAAAEAGADVIELGMPFSDPTADGPAIQRASERALARGTNISSLLGVVREVRKSTNVPILLFGYYNPILAYGEERFATDAAEAGADGMLVVNLPPEESAPLREPAIAEGLDFVPLVAPTSDVSRIKLAADAATAFVYYVSMTGVTGAKATDLDAAAARAGELQREIKRPIALGFGVKTPDDVAVVAKHVDGVVVGSAVVTTIEESTTSDEAVQAVSELISSLATGTRRN